jgi:hypothetical protein
MLRVLMALVLVVGLGAVRPAQAQGAEIEATITAQIEAFKADDFAQAFTYASPNIQGIFQTPENFGRMVRGGYPMVWRPGSVEYLDLAERSGGVFQTVLITDGEGAQHLLEYQMIELDGQWKINGVRLLQMPGVAA